MMRPEDIQNHDFLVGLRGYDRDEVRSFLARVAAEQRQLLAALEQGEASAQAASVPAGPAEEDFESMGASVAAILRTATEQAGEITGEAQSLADAMRNEAETVRREATESAKALREKAKREAEKLRQDAEQHVADARAEAERIVSEASERVRQIEVEHEARMKNKAEEIAARETVARARIVEATDELLRALTVLDDEGASPVETNHQEEQTPALG